MIHMFLLAVSMAHSDEDSVVPTRLVKFEKQACERAGFVTAARIFCFFFRFFISSCMYVL